MKVARNTAPTVRPRSADHSKADEFSEPAYLEGCGLLMLHCSLTDFRWKFGAVCDRIIR